MFVFAEETLDEIGLLSDIAVMVNACGAALAGGDHGLAGLTDRGAEVIGIVGFVGEDMPGGQVGDECMAVGDVAGLAGRDNEAHRVAQVVDRDVQLGGQPASAAADGAIFRPPFCPWHAVRPDDGGLDDQVIEVLCFLLWQTRPSGRGSLMTERRNCIPTVTARDGCRRSKFIPKPAGWVAEDF